MAFSKSHVSPITVLALSSLAVTYLGAAFVWYYRPLQLRPRNTSALIEPGNGTKAPKKDTLDSTKTLTAADYIHDGKHHLLLAATGSVATIKIPNIIEQFARYHNISIRLILSESAVNFLQAQSGEQPSLGEISRMKNIDGIYLDEDEWKKPWVRGDSILHIELRRWADLMVIAPLSADSLAKIALGFSDNLVTSVVRAWDTTGHIDPARPEIGLPYGNKKGIIVAPAMNTAMWNNPATADHVSKLETLWSVQNGGWFEVLRPVEKSLACGDTGSGAMHDWRDIVSIVEARLHLKEQG